MENGIVVSFLFPRFFRQSLSLGAEFVQVSIHSIVVGMISPLKNWRKHEPVDIYMRITVTPRAQSLFKFEVWAEGSCKLQRIDAAAECLSAFSLENGVWGLLEQSLKLHTLLSHLVQTCRPRRVVHALQDSVEKHSHRDGIIGLYDLLLDLCDVEDCVRLVARIDTSQVARFLHQRQE